MKAQSDPKRTFKVNINKLFIGSNTTNLNQKFTHLQSQIKSKCQNYKLQVSKLRTNHNHSSQNITVSPFYIQSSSTFQSSHHLQKKNHLSTNKLIDFSIQSKVNKKILQIKSLFNLIVNLDGQQLQYSEVKDKYDYLMQSNTTTGLRKTLELSKKQFSRISDYVQGAKQRKKQQQQQIKKQYNLRESRLLIQSQRQQQKDITHKRIKELENQMLQVDQKIYLYQAIFVNIYNLLLCQNQQKWGIAPVQDIKSAQYIQLQTKLRTLFSIIKLNKSNLSLLQKENIELRKQIKLLLEQKNKRGEECLGQNKNRQQWKLNQIEKNNKKIQEYRLNIPSREKNLLKNSNIQNQKLNTLRRNKMQELGNISQLYEQKIQLKYKEIGQLKQKLKKLKYELQNNIYCRSNEKQIIVKQQIEEQDIPNNKENKRNIEQEYTSRRFMRKRIRQKIVEDNRVRAKSSIKHEMWTQWDGKKCKNFEEVQNEIILRLLKINKKMYVIQNPDRNSVSYISEQQKPDLQNLQQTNTKLERHSCIIPTN